MYLDVLLLCMHVHNVYTVPVEARRGIWIPLNSS